MTIGSSDPLLHDSTYVSAGKFVVSYGSSVRAATISAGTITFGTAAVIRSYATLVYVSDDKVLAQDGTNAYNITFSGTTPTESSALSL